MSKPVDEINNRCAYCFGDVTGKGYYCDLLPMIERHSDFCTVEDYETCPRNPNKEAPDGTHRDS